MKKYLALILLIAGCACSAQGQTNQFGGTLGTNIDWSACATNMMWGDVTGGMTLSHAACLTFSADETESYLSIEWTTNGLDIVITGDRTEAADAFIEYITNRIDRDYVILPKTPPDITPALVYTGFVAITDYQITKAKRIYREANPRCALTGVKANVQVHHMIPVHIDRRLAACQTNLITLSASTHFWAAHLSNYKHYNANLPETIKQLKATLKRCAVRRGN